MEGTKNLNSTAKISALRPSLNNGRGSFHMKRSKTTLIAKNPNKFRKKSHQPLRRHPALPAGRSCSAPL